MKKTIGKNDEKTHIYTRAVENWSGKIRTIKRKWEKKLHWDR